MHRLIRAKVRLAAALCLSVLAVASLSCGPSESVRDQADVERLRMRITEVASLGPTRRKAAKCSQSSTQSALAFTSALVLAYTTTVRSGC